MPTFLQRRRHLMASRYVFPGFANSDAEAFVTAMDVEPNDTRKGIIDDLFVALAASTAYAKLDYIHVYAAHTSQAGTLNLIDPETFQATLVNSPTFTVDRGFTTNGTTSEVDTGFNPATASGNYVQDSACFGIWSLTSGQSASSPTGWFDSSDGTNINPRNTSDLAIFRINNATAGTVASQTDGTGFLVANRSTSAAIQLYRTGASIGTATPVSTALNSETFRIGRTGSETYVAFSAAACLAGASLDATEQAALYTALRAYMTAVGVA